MRKIVLLTFLLLFLSKTSVSFSNDKYPIFKNTFIAIKEKYVENLNEQDIYELLISSIEERFELGLESKRIKGKVNVFLQKKSLKIRGTNEKRLVRFCEFVKPLIYRILSANNITVDYDLYLADLLISKTDPNCFIHQRMDYGHIYEDHVNNNLKFIINKKGEFIIYNVVLDSNKILINAGAKILEINQMPVKYLTSGFVSQFFYDKKGTNMDLKIQEGLISKDVVYRSYNTSKNNVSYEKISNEIGLIKFHSYLENGIADSLKKILFSDTVNVAKLVIDLRSNPGGSLKEVSKILGIFVGRDYKIGELKTKRGTINKFYSESDAVWKGKIIIVLVDSLTSSGGEIIAKVLQESKTAKIVGQKTMGEGAIQRTIVLPNNYVIKITIASFSTQNKFRLDYDSVIPDVKTMRRLNREDMITLLEGVK